MRAQSHPSPLLRAGTYTLEAIRGQRAKLPPAHRARITRALALGRQRSEAADALFAGGFVVEALPLAASALEATMDALLAFADAFPDQLAPREGEPAWATALRARGAGEKEVARLAEALASAELPRPELESELREEHGGRVQALLLARHALDRRVALLTAPAAAIGARIAVRVLAALAVASSAVALAVFGIVSLVVWLRGPSMTVSATGIYGEDDTFAARRAIDGQPGSWWLLPDGEQGSLEVRFRDPRRVQRVRLLNTSNAPYFDRATHQYRVELVVRGEVAHSIEGTFAYTPTPQWRIEQAGVDDVEAIRFVVVSHYRAGGGLSELAWE